MRAAEVLACEREREVSSTMLSLGGTLTDEVAEFALIDAAVVVGVSSEESSVGTAESATRLEARRFERRRRRTVTSTATKSEASFVASSTTARLEAR